MAAGGRRPAAPPALGGVAQPPGALLGVVPASLRELPALVNSLGQISFPATGCPCRRVPPWLAPPSSHPTACSRGWYPNLTIILCCSLLRQSHCGQAKVIYWPSNAPGFVRRTARSYMCSAVRRLFRSESGSSCKNARARDFFALAPKKTRRLWACKQVSVHPGQRPGAWVEEARWVRPARRGPRRLFRRAPWACKQPGTEYTMSAVLHSAGLIGSSKTPTQQRRVDCT